MIRTIALTIAVLMIFCGALSFCVCAADGVDNPDGISTNAATTWIIIVCAVFFCAIISVVIILSKKNKKYP